MSKVCNEYLRRHGEKNWNHKGLKRGTFFEKYKRMLNKAIRKKRNNLKVLVDLQGAQGFGSGRVSVDTV